MPFTPGVVVEVRAEDAAASIEVDFWVMMRQLLLMMLMTMLLAVVEGVGQGKYVYIYI